MENNFLVKNISSDYISIKNDLFLNYFGVFGMDGINLIGFLVSRNVGGWW
jgi:hypothetical protein